MWKWLATICFGVLMVLGRAGWAGAGDCTWQGGTGNWSVSSNWDANEPASGDHAYVSNSGTAQITEPNEACTDLYLGYGAAESGAVDLSGTGSLSTATEYVGYSGTGTFTQSGGTNAMSGWWAGLYLGYHTNATGTYTLSGTGELSANNEVVGEWGTGTFTQTGGTNTISAELHIGCYPDSGGTYTLSGTGQFSADSEFIGYNGTGTFTQTGGTNTITQDLVLGLSSTAGGTYAVSGGTLTTGNLSVGDDGVGTFAVTGHGATLEAGTYSQNDLSTLVSEIGSGGISLIDVAGTAALDGTWTVVDLGAPMGTFDILTAAGGITGSFDAYPFPDLVNWSWGIDGGTTLWVQHVPEPGTLLLLVLGAVAGHRRRG